MTVPHSPSKIPATHKDGVYQITKEQWHIFEALQEYHKEDLLLSLKTERGLPPYDMKGEVEKRAHKSIWHYNICQSVEKIVQEEHFSSLQFVTAFFIPEGGVLKNRVLVKIEGSAPLKTERGPSKESHDFTIEVTGPEQAQCSFHEGGPETKEKNKKKNKERERAPSLSEETLDEIFLLSLLIENLPAVHFAPTVSFSRQAPVKPLFIKEFGLRTEVFQLIESLSVQKTLTDNIPSISQPSLPSRKL